MGPIGMPELIVLSLVMLMLAIGIFLIILIVRKLGGGNQAERQSDRKLTVQEELAMIEGLKAEGLITDAGYQMRRRQILDRI